MNSKLIVALMFCISAISFQACNEDSAETIADFTSTVTSISQGQTINFFDISEGTSTSWAWTFEGGTPSTSSAENPEGIAYATAGTYDVTLTITDENGTGSITKEDYITVNQLSGGCGTITSVTDIDGNVYGVVTIGSQCWMESNLRTTKYKDGSAIPQITDSNDWKTRTTHAYCWYDNDNSNETTYGKLYNWYAIEDARGICPEGWHVPHDAEWKVLEDYLGADDDVSGGNLKETGTDHWLAPNTGATNSSGFTGLPGGMRFQEGQFDHMGKNGLFWSSRRESESLAFYLNLTYDSAISYRTYIYKRSGFSCRCVKD